jgi:hypothetical protein
MMSNQPSRGVSDLWESVANEWRNRHKQSRNDYNVWLDDQGRIKTHLSVYDNHRTTVPKLDAEALSLLDGQRPMQLVMQTATRSALERAVTSGVWRVQPHLPVLVMNAIQQYEAVRAPLNPLSKAQRLGYIDEHGDILCIKTIYAE